MALSDSCYMIFNLMLFGTVSAVSYLPRNSIDNPWNVTIIEPSDSPEIRCYCNLPTCVSTSYMCKSKIPGCFSDMQDSMNSAEAIHGCLDFLPKDKEEMCQNSPGGEGLGGKHSLLLCCREDLCNHVDSANRMTNNDSLRHLRDEEQRSIYERQTPSYSSQEVWFKAATIAVPICGLLILLMLIILAMKILKSDPPPNQPKLWVNESTAGLFGGGLVMGRNSGLDSGCCGTKKVPLLFQQNDCSRPVTAPLNKHVQEKNETNAKLNLPSDLTDFHKPTTRTPCNVFQPLLLPSNLPSIHVSSHNNMIHSNHSSWELKKSPKSPHREP